MNLDAPYAIVAAKEGKGRIFAEAVYRELQARGNDFCFVDVSIQNFTDGEFKPILEGNVRDKRCFFIHDSNKEPARWFTELCLVNSTLRDCDSAKIIDVLPYMRFGRQDKKESEKVRTPISLEVVAEVVELYAKSIVTMDIHNDSAIGFFRMPRENLSPFPVMAAYLKQYHPKILENLVVASTDVGGGKRTSYAAQALGIEDVVIGYKERPSVGAVKRIAILGEVAGKDVLFTDDIMDSATTMRTAAVEVRKKGARHVYGYSTHALFTKGIDYAAEFLDRMFIGDTLFCAPHSKVEVISYAPRFAETIYRMAHGKSVKELA